MTFPWGCLVVICLLSNIGKQSHSDDEIPWIHDLNITALSHTHPLVHRTYIWLYLPGVGIQQFFKAFPWASHLSCNWVDKTVTNPFQAATLQIAGTHVTPADLNGPRKNKLRSPFCPLSRRKGKLRNGIQLGFPATLLCPLDKMTHLPAWWLGGFMLLQDQDY